MWFGNNLGTFEKNKPQIAQINTDFCFGKFYND